MNKNRFLLSLCILFLCVASLLGQETDQRKADAFFAEKDYYSAIPLYQDILKKDSKNRSAIFSLASCYLGINNDENAVPYLGPLTVVSDSIGSDSYNLFANFYAGKGRFQEAANLLKEARAKFPSDTRFVEQLMYAYESLGQFSDALAVLETSPLPVDRIWYERKIGYLVKLKQFDLANTLISDKMNEGKDNNFWQEMKASLLAGMGQLIDAEKIWLSLYQQTRDISYVKRCGQAWLSVQNRPAAVKVVRSIISSTDPNSALLAANVMKDLALYSDLVQLYLEQEKKLGIYYDTELFSLYELTSDSAALTGRYLDYLRRTMDIQIVRTKLLQIAEKGNRTMVLDAVVKSESVAGSKELKAALEMVLYDITFRNNETAVASTHVTKILDLTQNFGFALSAADDFAAKQWFDPARNIVLDVIKGSTDETKIASAMIKLASIYYMSGELAAALKVLNDVAVKYPGKYSEDELNTYRGVVYLETDSFNDAISAFQKVKKRDGSVQIKMGLTYFLMNKSFDAIDILKKAEKDPAVSAESLLMQGYIAEYDSGRAAALEIFDGLVRGQPADPYALNALREIFGLKHIFVGSSSNLLKIYASGKRAEMGKKYQEAAKIYASIIPSIDKYSYYFGMSTALAYADAGNNTEAIAWFGKVIVDPKVHPWFKSYAMERSGEIMERTGRKQEALDLYRKLILADTQYVRQKEVRGRINALKKELSP